MQKQKSSNLPENIKNNPSIPQNITNYKYMNQVPLLLAPNRNINQHGQWASNPIKMKARDLNFEDQVQIVKFFVDWRQCPANIAEQIKNDKWTDMQISNFCFSCQFVEYDVEDAEIKNWYRRLSLFLQKQAIKLTRYDLKKSDIKNLQQIYNESKILMNNLRDKAQITQDQTQQIYILTKYTLLNRSYEKLTLITFFLSFTCLFLILFMMQYINFSSRSESEKAGIVSLGSQAKKKYEDLWNVWTIFAIAINSLIGTATIFFAVKKFTPYFAVFYKKIVNLDDELPAHRVAHQSASKYQTPCGSKHRK